MKFALVEGEPREAQPRLQALCRDCGREMTAKCGRYRVWHWAHRDTDVRTCDPWWEPETEWHRTWKNHFPEDWQEVSHTSHNGEKHRADVETKAGVVLEFQHSPLSREERKSRENFYPKLIWVVDARQRKRDARQFFGSLGGPIGVRPRLPIYSVATGAGALMRDWGASRVPVYFDFGASETANTPGFNTTALWRLTPRSRDGRTYVFPVARTEFSRIHLEGEPFEDQCAELVELVADYLMRRAIHARPLISFEQYSHRRQGRMRRF